jgi:cytochrome P450
MAARGEDGAALTDAQVKDEVMTLILAGHETTANALSWAISLLSRHPDAARLVREEALALGRQPTAADALPYTDRVIAETMRLYPPAWMVVRRALHDDVVCGYRVPAGASVEIAPWTLHRHPRHWPEPHRFDPDRFAPERAEGRSPWVYLPFGGGPRVCIGKGFALLEARLVLATLAQHVELAVLNQPVPHPTVTLRPSEPVRARVRARVIPR